MDGCLKNTYRECEVKRCIQVALLCVQKFANDRPIMSTMVSMLRSDDGGDLPEPKEPRFLMERSSSPVPVGSYTAPSFKSNNTITITDLEAR